MNQPISGGSHLRVSRNDYHGLIERLASIIHESDWKFDKILCLTRGGLRVGDQLLHICDLPLAILAASNYRGVAGTQQSDFGIAQYITTTHGELSGRVSLVDDLVDSGVTLERVGRHLRGRYPTVTDVHTAVLWHKACSEIKPDYAVQYLVTNPWVHQPFEEYDTLRPHNLTAQIERGKVRSAGNGETSAA